MLRASVVNGLSPQAISPPGLRPADAEGRGRLKAPDPWGGPNEEENDGSQASPARRDGDARIGGLGLRGPCARALGGAEAAAKPPKCGDTITTDTTLHGDLINCPNNGTVIGADNVTLDLNYHRIDGDGFLVNEKDDHSILKGNTAKGAGDDGFDVRSRTAKLTGNRAVRNRDLGIAAVRGVTDGGGNVARHNRDPRQCTHIVCG